MYLVGYMYIFFKNLFGNNDEKKLLSFMEILYFLNIDFVRII